MQSISTQKKECASSRWSSSIKTCWERHELSFNCALSCYLITGSDRIEIRYRLLSILNNSSLDFLLSNNYITCLLTINGRFYSFLFLLIVLEGPVVYLLRLPSTEFHLRSSTKYQVIVSEGLAAMALFKLDHARWWAPSKKNCN